jgi:ketosteroid isomerase-like protein
MRAGFWKTGRPDQVLSYDHLEIRPLGPDHALATGEYVLSGAGKPDRTGWFTTIWERTPTGWRMIHDHS